MGSNIRASLRQFLLSECLPGEDPDQLTDDARLRDDGIIDSMKLLQLVSFLEKEVGFEIEAHEVTDSNFGSIEEIVSFVERRVAG